MCALSELSKKWQVPIYVPSDLANQIFRWFGERYGDRLKMGLSLGLTLVVIKGDAFKLSLPLMFGTIGYVLDSGPDERNVSVSGRPTKVSNITKLVDGLTIPLVSAMLTEERNDVVNWFGSAMIAGSEIDSIGTPPLISEAKGDLIASVEHLFSRPVQFGLSQWSSLQAVEKFLKAFIREKGGQFARIHLLDGLAKDAESQGLATVDRSALAAVQCSAGVRYGSEKTTPTQAYQAHRAALSMCGVIASQFPTRNESRIERYDCTSRQGNSQMVLLMRSTKADFDRARSQQSP